MDEVSQVRERTDIVALIQGYVPLKKMGSNFKANCPFHHETTPSFVVSPERQIWHCFGCGKGGDCFSFLMEYERMEFPEALRILAQKAGVVLSNKSYDVGVSGQKEKIYVLNALASEFYHFLLTKHQIGKPALSYVQERQIKPQTINTYMIGFAPGSGVSLVNYLIKKKGYTAQDVLDAGLATQRGRDLRDFFIGRLIFPLYDHRGNIIGFSGRILTNSTTISKYINTRETVVYHKGSVFFGLNSAKEAIKKENKALIMEGELDVITAFQEGITNAVAIKGTALTEDQVTLLARFTTNISLCLDSDKAGQEAMKRSLPILEKKGITTTLVEIPNGKDPDEAIKEDPISFKKAIKHARPVYDVLLEMLVKANDSTTVEGKKKVGSEMLSYISYIQNEIVKEHYLRLLSQSIGISQETLVKELTRIAKKEIIKKEVPVQKEVRPREEVLEEYFVSLLVQHSSPQLLLTASPDLQTHVWCIPALGKIVQRLFGVSQGFSAKTFLATLPTELVDTFDRCFLLPLPQFVSDDNYALEVKKIADELILLGLKRQIKEITKKMDLLEQETDTEGMQALQEQLSSLLTKLSHRESTPL